MTENVLVIDVTADDIAHGCKGDSGACPIALAAGQAMPFALDIEVTAGSIEFAMDSNDGVLQRFHIITGSDMDRWIIDFDDGHPVEPKEFHLPLDPDQHARVIAALEHG